MNYFLKSLLSQYCNHTFKISVRFYEKRNFIRRFGYVERYHSKGLLPRVKGDKGPLQTIPWEKTPDPWRQKEALFGQNDYIDLLGDGSIHPSRIITNVPLWLRGFSGNEMQMLIRKRTYYSYWKWLRPKKWMHLNKRIDLLYKKLNYRTVPPKPRYPWYTKFKRSS